MHDASMNNWVSWQTKTTRHEISFPVFKYDKVDYIKGNKL